MQTELKAHVYPETSKFIFQNIFFFFSATLNAFSKKLQLKEKMKFSNFRKPVEFSELTIFLKFLGQLELSNK